MKNETITIHGIIDGKTVINPIFDWKAASAATETVVLKKEDGTTVVSEETDSAHLELSKELEYDSKYALTVTGSDGNVRYSTTFETLHGTESPRLGKKTISLCEPYKSHMVLQRGKELSLCGRTAENVLVVLELYGTKYYAVSDEEGDFTFTLPPLETNATPSSLEVRILKNKKCVLQDVLVGDVYLFSGQSNMQRGLTEKGVDIADYQTQDVDNAIACGVRFYTQTENRSSVPLDETLNGNWFKVESRSSSQYKTYSAIAFMVGSMLGAELAKSEIPLGVLFAAKGDTNIVDWMGGDYYNGTIATKNERYNAMIHPLRRVELTGVVWYQGCNNWTKGIEYKEHLQNLKTHWRALFRNETLPFYVVQLPVYDKDDFRFVREAQLKACEEDPNAYLIATCDGGDQNDIHPKQKRYICERLTKSILSTLYGADYLPQGPTYLSHEAQGNVAIVTVNYGEGLHAEGGAIRGFQLAAADGKYYDAAATIQNGKIHVTSEKVSSPVYIRYGFTKSPLLNLYNKDGFLMSPFRTDAYNRGIDLLDYSGTEKYGYKSDGSETTYRVVSVDGKTGTTVTKKGDGKEYGALQLEKSGSIGYKETGMKLVVLGNNSGATILFRIEEGSGEIWAYSFTDDFTSVKEFNFPTSEFACVYNRQDGVIDYQRVTHLEVWIKATNTTADTSITILEAKFTEAEKTAPKPFDIFEAKNDGHECTIKFSQSLFADRYRVIVSANGTDFSDPIYDRVTDQNTITFNAALCAAKTPYFVKIVAQNDLGDTVAQNSGYPLSTVDRLVIASMDFSTDKALQNYVKDNMVVHDNLKLSRSEKGIKINVSEPSGWMHCIVKTSDGANKGYNALKVYLDLNEYKGGIVVQLQDKDGMSSYSCTLYTNSKKEGYFEIPFSSFSGFNGDNVGRIAFNFSDSVGGANDNVYLGSVEFVK